MLFSIFLPQRNPDPGSLSKLFSPFRFGVSSIDGLRITHMPLHPSDSTDHMFFFFFLHTSTFQLLDKPWSQVSSLLPPRFLPSIFIAHRVQQSHCLSIVHRMLLTHALALSASQFVHKKKSQLIYSSMHSAGLELTKLTYTKLEDTLIRHRGDRM